MARIYYQRARLSYSVRNGPAEDAKLREAQERRGAVPATTTSTTSKYKSKYTSSTRARATEEEETPRATYIPFSTTLNATKRLDEMHQERKYRYTERAGAAAASARVSPTTYSSASDYVPRSSSSSYSSRYTPSSRSSSRADLGSTSTTEPSSD
jgi:hypothetical protein